MIRGRHLSGSMWWRCPGFRIDLATWVRTTVITIAAAWWSRPPMGWIASTLPSSWTGHSATRGGVTASESIGVSPAWRNLSRTWRTFKACLPGCRMTPGHRRP